MMPKLEWRTVNGERVAMARNLDPETSWTICLTADDARDAAALIRAQAAEIARHPAALQEARNAALREAAEVAKGEGDSEFFNPVQPGHTDMKVTPESLYAWLEDNPLPADARFALAAFASVPNSITVRMVHPEGEICPDCMGSSYVGYPEGTVGCYHCRGQGCIAPQPVADEREAMAVAMTKVIRDNIDIEWTEAKTAADALLAAGWTRKREEG